jgi:hypothetical protein
MVLFDTSSFSGISTKVSGLSRHLPKTCPESLQMRKRVLETGSVLRKKGSGGPTKKKQLKRLKRLNKELQRPQINASRD